jgi:hypothetical protein
VSLYYSEAFACLVFVAPSLDGYVLLSIVTQAFAPVVFICMCAVEVINEGCQWEVQTDEGYIPYWDS